MRSRHKLSTSARTLLISPYTQLLPRFNSSVGCGLLSAAVAGAMSACPRSITAILPAPTWTFSASQYHHPLQAGQVGGTYLDRPALAQWPLSALFQGTMSKVAPGANFGAAPTGKPGLARRRDGRSVTAGELRTIQQFVPERSRAKRDRDPPPPCRSSRVLCNWAAQRTSLN